MPATLDLLDAAVTLVDYASEKGKSAATVALLIRLVEDISREIGTGPPKASNANRPPNLRPSNPGPTSRLPGSGAAVVSARPLTGEALQDARPQMPER